MECPTCGTRMIGFRVPAECREFAPEGATTAGICPDCLGLATVDDATAEFARLLDGFPAGEAGAAMALAVGLLVESVVLNHDAIAELFERVSDQGADPWLVLERLAAAPTVDPDADLDRLRRQLDQLG